MGRAACHHATRPRAQNASPYVNWLETLENLAFSVVPKPLTTAIIAMELPAAISPYSIAVAPDSLFRKAVNLDMVLLPLTVPNVVKLHLIFEEWLFQIIQFVGQKNRGDISGRAVCRLLSIKDDFSVGLCL
jgi:hypothetical protein